MSHLDEVERRMDQAVMQRFRHRKGAGAGAVGVAAPSGGGFQRTPDAEPMNEGDFQTAMIRRLKLLEQDARSKSALLEQARVENAELQKKIRVLEERLAPQSGQSSSADDVGDNSLAAEALEVIDHLRSENSRLRREADGAWEQVRRAHTRERPPFWQYRALSPPRRTPHAAPRCQGATAVRPAPASRSARR
ncbi:unnamed protein product [Pedinophyceae sp. YPF-701]|nr:unnamed protein product [Pedinophyceae sp. YPF-701]